MNPALVSVVVPAFRSARFLGQMLDSALSQDYQPLEIVVVDGGSDDGTVELLQAYASRHPDLRWVSEPDDGPADAVNKGLAMARGEYAWIQNADDVFRRGAISAALQAFRRNPHASFVYGDVERVDEQGDVTFVRHFPAFSWPAFFAWSCTVAQGSILFRRDLALKVGGWDATYYSCDLNLWLRLALHAPAVHLPQVLSAWRRYPGQRTSREHFGRIWEGYWRMIRDCPELEHASLNKRRLARASCHLLALRFYPERKPWRIRAHVLFGLLLHPGAVRYLPLSRFARLLPGMAFVRRQHGQRANP